MNTFVLADELAPLHAQIEKAQHKLEALEGELRVIEAELETFSSDRQRFDALQDVCNALDKLVELKGDELFWGELPEVKDTAGHVERLRGRVAGFEVEISGILEKQESLTQQINQRLGELDILSEEEREAYDREERRQEEFVIEREVSSVPYRTMIMPWTKEAESERRLRNAVLVALVICFVFGAPILLIKLPLPDRDVTVVEIPKRLVKLVKKEPPRVAAIAKPEPKQPKKEPKKPKKEPKPKPKQKKKADKKPKVVEPPPKQTKVADSGGGKEAARKKAENVGVMVFRDALADLMKETPVAKVGTETLLRNDSQQVKGQAVAQRSLVALQAKGGSSGGIGNAKVSRNIGNGNADRLGSSGSGNGLGFVQAESAIAGFGESSRPLSDGVAAGRTDEEIQIVFDRYKATLYRIYNNELRKDPTLGGNILMRISIEPNGSVSMCEVESTDLASPDLVEKIVARIKKFNFGPKEDVLRMTILYPIDFLPAG